MRTRPRGLVVLAALAAALALPLTAVAADGDEVRRAGSCSRASEIALRVRADDGDLQVELRIDARRRSRWSAILLHERRIVFRGTLRAGSSGVRLRRTVPDWFGSDTLVARATGPRAEACRVSATL